MQFLVVGDLHYQTRNEIQTNLFHQELIKIIKEKQISHVVFLGDMMHRFEKIDLNPLTRISKLLEDIHIQNVEIYICIGNHDISNGDHVTNKHAFNPFKMWKNTHIIDFPQVFTVDNFSFCCLPYIPDGHVLKFLKDYNIDIPSVNLFFCHSDFLGSSINNLSKTKADKWLETYPLMIGGHLHDYEEVQKNLIYIGTPYQQTFSDSQNKGVYILNIDQNGFEIHKISLNIPSKIFLTINYKELYSVIIPEGEVKIKIIGPITEVKKLLSTEELKKKFQNVNIVYVDTSTKIIVPNQSKNILPFSVRVRKEMDSHPEIKNLFEKIFN